MTTNKNRKDIILVLLLPLLFDIASTFTLLPPTTKINYYHQYHHRHNTITTTTTTTTTTTQFFATTSSSSASSPPANKKQQPYNNVLILDHLNINHEKHRHDLLKAFYFDFLQCIPDPRKAANLEKGQKTLWANIGAHQVHLPEGNPHAQVLEGLVTLVYPSLDGLMERSEKEEIANVLRGSKFRVEDVTTVATTTKDGRNVVESMQVTDPWGTRFHLVRSKNEVKDERGVQKGGDKSEGTALQDLTLYVSPGTNLKGIGRFYDQILGAPILDIDDEEEEKVVVSMGPHQTLTFCVHPNKKEGVSHVDMVDEGVENKQAEGKPHYLSNYGPHISMYISDIRSTYQRIEDLGITYVNPRFKRRAYGMEEVVDDCMFRVVDIVDPEDEEKTVILQLEHEVRSVMKRDGSLYKSCPFVEIPKGCVI